jgi:hypothetical protein
MVKESGDLLDPAGIAWQDGVFCAVGIVQLNMIELFHDLPS